MLIVEAMSAYSAVKIRLLYYLALTFPFGITCRLYKWNSPKKKKENHDQTLKTDELFYPK